jgi:hypothetical protein
MLYEYWIYLHPTDVLNDLDVIESSLLELQEFCCLLWQLLAISSHEFVNTYHKVF